MQSVNIINHSVILVAPPVIVCCNFATGITIQNILMKNNRIITGLAILMLLASSVMAATPALSARQNSIVEIASNTAIGNLDSLYSVLNHALDDGMTINELSEVLVHTYAYCGFPRSLQGLKTLVRVLGDRKARGITDTPGREATPLDPTRNRYERGRAILAEISGVPADAPKADYAQLAPEIEVFLKEHLFSDLFERDVLTYAEREIATVAVIASLGKGVEPMLNSHSLIAMRLGATPEQIAEIKAIASANLLLSGNKEKPENLYKSDNN